MSACAGPTQSGRVQSLQNTSIATTAASTAARQDWTRALDCRHERIILRARTAAIAHVLSLTFLSNVVAYVCRAHLDRIGSMLARLDNLSQRHRSVTLHAAAPEVDFPTPMRCERIPGRPDPCSRNFRRTPATPSPRPSVYRLRKLRELQHPGGGRPAPGLEIGITLAEIAETPAMARPPDAATEIRVGRKGRKGRKPVFRAL